MIKHGPGLLIYLADDERPIGIEIAIPSLVTLEAVNEILISYGLKPIDESELASLKSVAYTEDTFRGKATATISTSYLFFRCQAAWERHADLGAFSVLNASRGGF